MLLGLIVLFKSCSCIWKLIFEVHEKLTSGNKNKISNPQKSVVQMRIIHILDSSFCTPWMLVG